MDISSVLAQLAQGAQNTVIIATGSWVVGLLVGGVLAALRGVGGPWLSPPLSFVTVSLRSMPQLVVLYLLFFGLGAYGVDINAVVAAIFGLGIVEAAYMAEYFRASFLTVSERQRDAGRSLGLSGYQIVRRIVIPQAQPFLYPPALNSFVGLLKNATLASALGAPEILYRGQAIITRTGVILEVIVVVCIVYLVITIPLAHFALRLEQRAERYRLAS